MMILNHYKHTFAQLLSDQLTAQTWWTVDEIEQMIEFPPQVEFGDLAFPCFQLSKLLRKAPPVIAAELQSAIQSAWMQSGLFSDFKIVWPYLNAFIHQASYIDQVLKQTAQQIAVDPTKPKILLEYMSANPNKPLHIGHSRNVCIGDTLRRVFDELGYPLHTSDYGDDSGVNVGYNILGHLVLGIPFETDKKFDHYCGEVYLQVKNLEAADSTLKEKMTQILLHIEHNDDPAITAFHKQYVKKCTIEQLRTCRRMGARFDVIDRETDVLHTNFFAEALELLKTRGHVKYADEGDAKGCRIIDLSSLPQYANEEKQYQILVKSDWVATYVAKDIAFALWKLGFLSRDFQYESFVTDPDGREVMMTTQQWISIAEYRDYNRAITVIDNRQLPAQQVVHGALQLLGYLTDDKRYEPLGYGVLYLTPPTLLQMGCVLNEEEKNQTRLPFASRKGRSMSVDNLLDLLHTKVFDASRMRHSDLDETVLHDIAEAVAVSSLRFLLTKTDVSKDMTFDLDECLDLEGETWAYVLYTWARLASIIAKSGVVSGMDEGSDFSSLDLSWLTQAYELDLIKWIDQYQHIVQQVADGLAPHLICRYILDGSKLINSYYAHTKIMWSEDSLLKARIALLTRVREVLDHATRLVGMRLVERM